MCVTLVISPLVNLTEIWTMEVMEVKNWMEWTMWSVAPLSRIQSMEAMWVVTTFKEKTKYSKEGVNQIPENSCPWSPMEEWVMMLVTWWVSEATSGGTWVPKWPWEFSKPSNCWYSTRVRLTPWFELSSISTTLLAKEPACWPLDLNLLPGN